MQTRYSTKDHNQRLSRGSGISRGLRTWGLCFNNRSSYRKTISSDCATCNGHAAQLGSTTGKSKLGIRHSRIVSEHDIPIEIAKELAVIILKDCFSAV